MKHVSSLCHVVCLKACRGKKYDWGVEVADVDTTDAAPLDPDSSVRKIPVEADFLFAYSVVPGRNLNVFLTCEDMKKYLVCIIFCCRLLLLAQQRRRLLVHSGCEARLPRTRT